MAVGLLIQAVFFSKKTPIFSIKIPIKISRAIRLIERILPRQVKVFYVTNTLILAIETALIIYLLLCNLIPLFFECWGKTFDDKNKIIGAVLFDENVNYMIDSELQVFETTFESRGVDYHLRYRFYFTNMYISLKDHAFNTIIRRIKYRASVKLD